MRKKIIIPILTFSAVIFLSGCTSPFATNTKEVKDSVISDAISIKNKAEDNLNTSIEKENNKIVNQNNQEKNMQNDETQKKFTSAIIHTTLGNITVEFYTEESPKTVANFTKLASEKFYDKTTFHRAIKGFMIQGGDPNSKDDDRSNDGMGGPGYKFADEFNSHKLVRGSFAMANSGPNTNGSQFFIVTAPSTPWLDGKHTNFGEVTSGLDVLDKIESLQTDSYDHPIKDVAITGIDLK